MVDPLMAHLLGNLIQRLKQQLHLTSIVVTHDMRFAKKLADRIVFLHQGEARFFWHDGGDGAVATTRFCVSFSLWTNWCCRKMAVNDNRFSHGL